MGVFSRNWPNHHDYTSSGFRAASTDPMLRYILWTVPTSFISQIWQQNFWDNYVQSMGTEALHVGPLTLGTYQDADPEVITNNAYPEFNERKYPAAADDMITPTMSAEQKRTAELRNIRRKLGQDILNSLHGTQQTPQIVDIFKENYAIAPEYQPQVPNLPVESDGESCDTESSYDTENDIELDPTNPSSFANRPPRERFIEVWFKNLYNRQQIDFDTMLTPFPEDLLRAYCNRLDPQLNLQKREFRQWLMHTSVDGRLFR